MEKTLKLFAKLGAAYGYLWQNQFKDSDMFRFAKELWAKKIELLSDEEINFAFEKCIESLEFPPTLPQFIKKCKIDPEDLGYLPTKMAYHCRKEDPFAKKIAEKFLKYNPHATPRNEKEEKEFFESKYEFAVNEKIIGLNNCSEKRLEFIKQKFLVEEKPQLKILPKKVAYA